MADFMSRDSVTSSFLTTGSETQDCGGGAEDLASPFGERDSRWWSFAQGGPGDRAKPSAWQLMILSDVSGPDGRCAGATDDEVFGVLGQWGAAGSWLEGRKLAVVRELIRRHPDERNVGTATASGLPWDWDDRLANEIALELAMSVPAARKLTWVAWALEARLPKVGKALDEGRLDAGRARTVVEETDVLLEPTKLAQAEGLILAGLDTCTTWTDLVRLVQRAVITVDPDGARKRREQEEKEHARIRFWREAAGTCALMGAGLPTDEALQAHARVEQRAQEYRAAGIKRPIDILRVAAYLDLLNLVPAEDRIARFEAEAADGPDQGMPGSPKRPGGRHAGGHSGTDNHADGDAGDNPGSDGPDGDGSGSDGNGGSPKDGPSPGSDGTGGGSAHDPEPAVASEVNLTLRHLDIPFATAAGLAQRAGEARSLGALDPAIARRLAEAAARHPGSKFCLTIVDSDGHAIGHGCCKPVKPRKSREPHKSHDRPRSQRDGPPPPSPSPSRSPQPPSPPAVPAPAFTLTPGGGPGPPGGYGSWVLTLPGRAGEYTVDLHPVPTGECGHQYESSGHDPGDLLRHLVNVRDGKCGFPACSRHAKETDFEHAQPHALGGRTCGCNCWSCSRSCHQVKQSEGWHVEEIRPGYHQWKTPSGRTYTQEPWRYPT
jgi:hypothetical protein